MFKQNLKFSLVLGLIFLVSACDSAAPKSYPFNYSGPIMGTSFNIKASELPEAVSVTQLQNAIKVRLDAINQRMSTYLKDSELSVINQQKTLQAQAVSAELFKVLTAAKVINKKSLGAFDITVGPLVNLWGFGTEGAKFSAPEMSAVQKILATTGDKYWSLFPENSKLQKQHVDLSLDLSALAKGYAVDEVALVMESYGVHDYLVEIGGELRLKGHNLQGEKWHIAIEKPTINKRELQKVIPVTGTAMATSGDYRNFFEQDGKRFSHTIDPRTGYPITHQLASVTVLHVSSMMADAWATALMVLGAEEGYKIAKKEQLAAFFIIKKQQGFAEQATPLFTKYTRVEK